MSEDKDMDTGEEVIEPNTYRTADTARAAYSVMSESPNKLFLPSNGAYLNLFDIISSHDTERAHLELRDVDVDLKFEEGKIRIGDLSASEAQLYDVIAHKGVDEIDTVLLRGLFSIIYFNLCKDIDNILKEPTEK